ncbi:MAG: LytTR family transcriptional regulator DNA-binding domain-containing protein [Chitinophagales bacterium]|nr:LytTR family transcriptional regulator DNA-binding domain-containing protein [Chitinophagales bacterium]
MLQSRPYRYNDVKLFLVLIPVIAAINYHLTYINIRLNWFLVLTYLIDTQQGYVGWLCCRAVIIYLDRVYPYQRNTTRRIFLQTFSSSIAGLAAIILQTMLVNRIFTDHPMPVSFFTVDIVIIAIWFLVVNGIYIGLHYYTLWQDTEEARQQEKVLRNDGYMVKFGKKNISIAFADIAGFAIEDEYTVLYTTHSRSYYLDESLDMVEQKLPQEYFFRLNRQSIIHRQLVTGFDRGENGKIQALIRPTEKFPQAIPVSRLKAPAFKSWFQPA